MTRHVAGLIASVAVVATCAVLAQTKPDFSGTWVAVSGSKEAIGEETLIKQDSTSITIGHGGSVEHASTYRLDGREIKQPNVAHGSETDTAQAMWDGEKIVIIVKLSNGVEHKRTLALQPDGTMSLEVTISGPGKPVQTIKAVHKKK
jgi:hypothetical protein